MQNNELINGLEDQLSIVIPHSISMEELEERVASQVNYLIHHDLNKLYSILYRVDVDEEKLKRVLKENNDQDAGKLISGLIIERQLKKIAKKF